MKLNWGQSIAIFYTFFVIVMVGMVVYSKGLDHSLVVDNYYEEDINYQQHIDKLNNARSLSVDLKIEEDETNQLISFQFPAEFSELSGRILFYRADDKSKDFFVKIEQPENARLVVSSADMIKGLWKVKVDWEGDGKEFYKEEILVI